MPLGRIAKKKHSRPALKRGALFLGEIMIAKIYVTLKSGVLDPQGKAVLHSLGALGYREVEDVRIGRFIEVKVNGLSSSEAKKRVEEMCEQLLANTVIESYRFELTE